MNDEKEKWIADVFSSMKESQRAKPGSELLGKIEDQIDLSKAKVVSMPYWKYAAAAAFLLLINSTALIYHIQNKKLNDEDVALVDAYSESLIRSFQIYE